MNKEFEVLNFDDVISGNPDAFGNLDVSRTSIVVHLLEAIEEYIGFDEIECEVLKPGARRWQKGRVRINLEFCPDKPSEPPLLLDDIRQNFDEAES